MELLILGLLLVAVMVYASTRIKKTAAAAFDAETVESDDFVIQKPEGFLNVINGDPKYVFEAYSKDFGVDGAENFRQGRITLILSTTGTIDDAVAAIADSRVEIDDDIAEVIGQRHYRLIDARRHENGVDFSVTYKIGEKNGTVYQLEAARLAETSVEFARKIEILVGSFELR